MRGRPNNCGAERDYIEEIGPSGGGGGGVVGTTRQAGEESPGPLSLLALSTQALQLGRYGLNLFPSV